MKISKGIALRCMEAFQKHVTMNLKYHNGGVGSSAGGDSTALRMSAQTTLILERACRTTQAVLGARFFSPDPEVMGVGCHGWVLTGPSTSEFRTRYTGTRRQASENCACVRSI